jgi:oligopeptide/dipeptide ABC transporter ATP-binding protein
LVLDEPTSALDVSVRAEIVNLLVRIQDELNLSYVFVSHDLSMVRHVSEEIAVMYLGRVVEMGRYEQVLDAPLHPYTKALGEAIPVSDPERERARTTVISTRAEVIETTPQITVGCPYAPRCPLVEPYCREVARPCSRNPTVTSCRVTSRSVTQPRSVTFLPELPDPIGDHDQLVNGFEERVRIVVGSPRHELRR